MLKVVNDPGRFSQPFAYIEIGKDIFETGDGKLIDCSVTVGEGKKQSSCSITISDPNGELAQKYFSGSLISGGIKLPDEFFEKDKSDDATISSRFEEQGPAGTNTNASTGTITNGAVITTEPAEVKAFLDTLALGESGDPTTLKLLGSNGYNVSYGGATFPSYSSHPGPKGKPAGRYQHMYETFVSLARMNSYKDFRPLNQDKAAIDLFKEKGAYELIKKGNIEAAIPKLAIWTSLPGKKEARWSSVAQFKKVYDAKLAAYKGSSSSKPATTATEAKTAASTPKTSTKTAKTNSQFPNQVTQISGDQLAVLLGGVKSTPVSHGVGSETYKYKYKDNGGLEKNTVEALKVIIAAAKKDNINLSNISGYRSVSAQQGIINGKAPVGGTVAQKAAAGTIKQNAAPGYSQHHTGRAVDFNSLSDSFGNTPPGKWLANNATKYGFVQGHPGGVDDGTDTEIWHWVYIGDLQSKTPQTLAQKAADAQGNATSSTTTTTQNVKRNYEGSYKGTEIKIAFSVDPGTYEIFTFIHSGTEFTGASNCTFKLSGMAIRGVMERRTFKEKKVKTTLKKFAMEIATKYKLKLDMKFEGPAYEAISQTGQTDLHILTKLVEEANLYMWEKNATLFIEKHPSFANKPIGFILRWGYNLDKVTITENAQTDVKATKTDDAKDKIEAIYPKISILTKPGTASQTLLENVTGVAKGQKAGTGTNVTTLSSYKPLAQPQKPDDKKNFKAFVLSCEFTTSQVALSSIYPLTSFYIEGFIPFMENRWFIESVTHNYRDGALRTSVQAYISIIPPRGSVEETTVSSRFEEQGPAGSSTFDGKFINPCAKGKVFRGGGEYGDTRTYGAHTGLDLGLPATVGEPILASAAGTVTMAGGDKYNSVHIKHDSKYVTKYLHNSKVSVKAGQKVKQGEKIAELGFAGLSKGVAAAHLHFDIYENDRHISPESKIGSVPRQ